MTIYSSLSNVTQSLSVILYLSHLQIMIDNTTCVIGNVTCSTTGSPAGLAVGLTLFFLLLVIVVGVIVYKYHSKMRNTLQFVQSRSQKKQDSTETPQDDSHHYTSMITEQPTGQTPIYENLTTTGRNRPSVNQMK